MADEKKTMEKAKYEITATIASTGAIVLATGWMLTWARIANAKLPSEDILAALPRSFFLQVAIQSTLSPLVISVALGGGWLVRYVNRYPSDRDEAIRRWSRFGLLLALASWGVAVLVNNGGSREAGVYVLVELLACALLGAAAGRWGALSYVYVGSRPARPHTGNAPIDWDITRPVAGFTIVLCFFVAGALRSMDAYFASDALPQAEVVVATPCDELTNGRPVLPTTRQIAAGGGGGSQNTSRCEVGGFYLGESSDWVYLIQKASCIPHGVPLLLDIRREDVQEVVVFKEKRPPCPDALAPTPRRGVSPDAPRSRAP